MKPWRVRRRAKARERPRGRQPRGGRCKATPPSRWFPVCRANWEAMGELLSSAGSSDATAGGDNDIARLDEVLALRLDELSGLSYYTTRYY